MKYIFLFFIAVTVSYISFANDEMGKHFKNFQMEAKNRVQNINSSESSKELNDTKTRLQHIENDEMKKGKSSEELQGLGDNQLIDEGIKLRNGSSKDMPGGISGNFISEAKLKANNAKETHNINKNNNWIKKSLKTEEDPLKELARQADEDGSSEEIKAEKKSRKIYTTEESSRVAECIHGSEYNIDVMYELKYEVEENVQDGVGLLQYVHFPLNEIRGLYNEIPIHDMMGGRKLQDGRYLHEFKNDETSREIIRLMTQQLVYEGKILDQNNKPFPKDYVIPRLLEQYNYVADIFSFVLLAGRSGQAGSTYPYTRTGFHTGFKQVDIENIEKESIHTVNSIKNIQIEDHWGLTNPLMRFEFYYIPKIVTPVLKNIRWELATPLEYKISELPECELIDKVFCKKSGKKDMISKNGNTYNLDAPLGSEVTEGPHIGSDNERCWEVVAKYRCRSEPLDGCDHLKGCTEKSSECVDNKELLYEDRESQALKTNYLTQKPEDNSNKPLCFYHKKTFECKKKRDQEALTMINSPIYCISGDCHNPVIEKNQDIGDIAYLAAAQNMKNCEKDNEGKCLKPIRIFPGTRDVCEKQPLGQGDCCVKMKKNDLWMKGTCPSEAKLLAEKKSKNLCHYIGPYKEKLLGLHTKTTNVYCCYPSELALIFHEEARKQSGTSWTSKEHKIETIEGVERMVFDDDYNPVMVNVTKTIPVINWGSPKEPNCHPLNLDIFTKLDYDKFDQERMKRVLINNKDDNLFRGGQLSKPNSKQVNRELMNIVDSGASMPKEQYVHLNETKDESKQLEREATEKKERRKNIIVVDKIGEKTESRVEARIREQEEKREAEEKAKYEEEKAKYEEEQRNIKAEILKIKLANEENEKKNNCIIKYNSIQNEYKTQMPKLDNKRNYYYMQWNWGGGGGCQYSDINNPNCRHMLPHHNCLAKYYLCVNGKPTRTYQEEANILNNRHYDSEWKKLEEWKADWYLRWKDCEHEMEILGLERTEMTDLLAMEKVNSFEDVEYPAFKKEELPQSENLLEEKEALKREIERVILKKNRQKR